MYGYTYIFYAILQREITFSDFLFAFLDDKVRVKSKDSHSLDTMPGKR